MRGYCCSQEAEQQDLPFGHHKHGFIEEDQFLQKRFHRALLNIVDHEQAKGINYKRGKELNSWPLVAECRGIAPHRHLCVYPCVTFRVGICELFSTSLHRCLLPLKL